MTDVMAEANSYTTELSSTLTTAASYLKKLEGEKRLPTVSRAGIWACALSIVSEKLVEGLSSIEKYTPEARSLMASDVNVIFANASKLLVTYPPCVLRDEKHASDFIKALYLSTSRDLESWIFENRANYSHRQMRGLARLLVQNQNFFNRLNMGHNKNKLQDIGPVVDLMYTLPLPEEEKVQRQILAKADAGISAFAGLGAAMMGGTNWNSGN